MSIDILINSRSYEVRLALVENGVLTEFHMQRPMEKGLKGNIYRGRVVRVLPGMQAAFVDIGLERTGFLYVDDVHITEKDIENRMLDRDSFPVIDELSPVPGEISSRVHGSNIEDLLTEGQDVLVQVSKDPIGTKGARLTCHITLPCRNLVFIPLTDHIGVSRKIENEEIRTILKEQIEEIRPQGTGFIVRTVAEHAKVEELEADMEFLMLLWDEIRDLARSSKSPALVYEDLDITLRSVRDLFTNDVDRLIIDDKAAHEKLLHFVRAFAPQLQDRISLYQGDSPLFEAHGIEVEINRAIEKKVWLRSGGYIIIESTEALSVIDVNTGRFVGKNDLNETIFKTNIEAAKEIAYQLRLRNIGGIIIIDFIDMEDEFHREELFTTFKEAVKKDKSRINILKLSEFGLVQMTRKRNSENLHQMMCEPCHYCAGEGMLKSRRTICYDIFRKLSRNAAKASGNTVTIRVHPRIADMLLKEEELTILQLEQEISKRLVITPAKDLHIEKYEIIWQR
ncbi:Rne/Rng family ribonuclease [Desulfoprunum benzoelyticum]|uniref:Ribonuclease G n=1 Tax=Desulfoprunum benzoelyticum TaxID=1506996 RepID=A0A840UL07_9BACT|nr:Rne/Rng family ribonuclease [Desulfoprunum benzoelyticum]MBB5346442.1 ribonuclease G [Desulfoprunum benzoelyticum]MBM9528560.1 Rne/Rng family ribonuclease [Desulfoprunum benzoelyticum]